MKTNKFQQRLKIGNEKEKEVCNTLNLIGLNCKQNNLTIVTDIDLLLEDFNIIMDVKYIHTVFENSERLVNIKPYNCLPIKKKTINKYNIQRKDKECWICFYIDFEKYSIKEIRFISLSKLLYLLNQIKNTEIEESNILNIDKNDCFTAVEFFNYCKEKQKLKNIKYEFK